MMIRLEQFAGVAPKISRRLLPPNMARHARNCKLLSGELNGINAPVYEHSFGEPTKYAVKLLTNFTLPEVPPGSHWYVRPGYPPQTLGSHGEYYLDTLTNNWYLRVEGGILDEDGEFILDENNQQINDEGEWVLQGVAAYGSHIWYGFASDDVDFVKGPLVNDTYERYYWTDSAGSGTVYYAPLETFVSGVPAFRLGVPTPTSAPVISVGASPSPIPIIESRAYVYTYVNTFSEESAPSLPVVGSGPTDAVWTISGIGATPPDMVGRCPIEKVRIYRTVTGQSSALYYFVAEVPLGTTTYADDIPSATVVQNSVCNSFNWDAPEEGLRGLVVHPSGALAAFKGREVFLSEPYRPWAWPTEYILALDHNIVGLAIYGNTLMVMTTSTPYYFSGTHPSNFSPQKSQSIEPCLSKRSIAATLQGVLYASPNGLVLFNELGANVVTNSIISRDEWQKQFIPKHIKAAQRGLSYIAFFDNSNGFVYSPQEPLGMLSTLDRFAGIDNIFADVYSGVIYIMSNNTLFEWDNPQSFPVYYSWLSREFDMPRPLNFGACIVKMDAAANTVPEIEFIEEREVWNQSRSTRLLNPVGYTPVGGSRWQMTPSLGEPNFNEQAFFETGGYDRRVYPLGGSPLFPTAAMLQEGAQAILRIYADGTRVAQLYVVPNQTMRLPSGFKAHVWQFELISNAHIYSLAVAETGKELMNV